MQGFFPQSTIISKAPQSFVAKCGKCGFDKLCTSPQMPVSGEGKRGILIVAEAPRATEDKQGIQLVGASGQLLERVILRFGVQMREACWLTNAMICRPPGNRTPKDQEINACRSHLLKTIRELKPKVIIPLGGVAIKSLISSAWTDGVGSITRWAGHNIPYHKPNAWVCPTYHPSYLLREHNHVLNKLFRNHLRNAFKHRRRPWKKIPDYRSNITCIRSPSRAAKVLRQIKKRGNKGMIAFDYETNKLKPDGDDAAIISCSVCWGVSKPEITIAFPWTGPVIPAMIDLLKSPILKVAANLKFEDRWTRKMLKCKVRNWAWDTMLAAHVEDNSPEVTSLSFQAFVRFGMPTYDKHIKPFLRAKKGRQVNEIIQQVGLNDLLLYNGLDSFLEFKLAVQQMKRFDFNPWE